MGAHFSSFNLDHVIQSLRSAIISSFPDSKDKLPEMLKPYWEFRDSLCAVQDGVVTYNDRTIVPESLRSQILDNLHCAHQGVSGMQARAMNTVFWPGISSDLEAIRDSCRTCHRNTPSQPKLPPVAPNTPKLPFEMICCDYFELKAHHYLIAADRLSGWVEVLRVQPSTPTAGSKGLCSALRRIFATFGVPSELSSDGGPEFVSDISKKFYEVWGTRHRLSSAYLPHSNGRAENAVKTVKRLIEDNINPNGDLYNDKLVAALLRHRNTPDRDCGLSPAEVIFGRCLRDSMPVLDRSENIFNNKNVRSEALLEGKLGS